MKVLPELLKSVEFGGGGPKVLNVIMKIAAKLSDDEYDSQITPVIVRLFQSPDRALRVCLLDNLPLMIDHLSQKIVSNQIFPQMVSLTPSCIFFTIINIIARSLGSPTLRQSYVSKLSKPS
jgi:SCY1-like protein 1